MDSSPVRQHTLASSDEDAPEPDRNVKAKPSHQIINQTWQSERLDELENALNSLVAPQRFTNASAGDHANGLLAYQGQASLGVHRSRIGRDIDLILEPEEMDDRMAFIMAASGTGELLLHGKTFTHATNRGVIITSGPERILRFGQETENRVLLASRASVAECCARLLGQDIPGFIAFDVDADLETPAGRSWLRLLSHAEAELSDPDALICHSPVAWRQFEQHILTGLLLTHRHEYSDALHAPQAAAMPFYVKRAEAYIEAHYAEPLSLAQIAAHAGVSARSLQNGFQSFRNITPMAYLRAMRLQRAHRALLAADPATATVTQIALSCGFAHLGEFGTAYRRVFGLTPSQTLHKTKV
jgi:AraC-like DNA-binding protein